MNEQKKHGSILMRSILFGCLFFVILICCSMLTIGYTLYSRGLDARYESTQSTGQDNETIAEIKRAELAKFMSEEIAASLVMGSIFLLISFLWIRERVIKPLDMVEQSVTDFARRSQEQDIPGTIEYQRPEINTADEIEDIADAIAMLTDDMNVYLEGLMLSRSEMRIMKRQVNRMDELAYKDALTGVNNKASYDKIKARLDWDIINNRARFAIVMVDINFLKHINDDFGHESGDTYIKNTVDLIGRIFAGSPIFRVGGDEFVVVLENKDYLERDQLVARLGEEIERISHDKNKDETDRLSAAIGMAVYSAAKDVDSDSVLRRADNMMYENKKAMKAVRTD